MLDEIDFTEVVTTEGAGSLERVDQRVRIGCQGEHVRYSEITSDIRGGEAADIGHPQVQHIDVARLQQNSSDPTPRDDPERPRLCRRPGGPMQRNLSQGVPLSTRAECREASERITRR